MPIPFLNSIKLNKNQVEDFCVFNYSGDPTLSSGADFGYLWLNTSATPKVLKFWDGTNYRTLIDSTTISSSTAGTANDLSGGVAGSLPYQQGVGDTTFLGIGSSGYILTSTGSAPQWSASIPSSSVSGLAASATTDTTNASNISSGTLGLARLSLASGQFYVGDGSNNPAATAKSSIPLSGFGNAAADINIGGFKITNSGTIGSGDADSTVATKGYVDSVAQGLDVKASCLVATTADITLASPGAVTIDGVYSATDFTAGTTRILVKDQSAAAENGIYIWQGPSSAMTRSADANTWDELVGAFTFIERGTANADSGWVCTVNAGGTLGSTAVTFVKFSQAGSYTAGNGIVQSGTSFNFAQSTPYTAGQIPFAKDADEMTFSANLHWDNGNNRLGIGTATPGVPLSVFSSDSTLCSFVRDLTTDAGVLIQADNGGAIFDTVGVHALRLFTNATERLKIASDGVCTWSNVGGVAGTAMLLSGDGLKIGTGSGFNSSRLVVADASPKTSSGQSITLGTATGGANDFQLIVARTSNTTGCYYFQTVEQGVGYKNLVFQPDGGNVGIGTATPAAKLHVGVDVYGLNKSAGVRIGDTGNNYYWDQLIETDGSANPSIVNKFATHTISKYHYGGGTNKWEWYTNNTLKATLDSSGNLGLGVTPSAWGAGLKALQVGAVSYGSLFDFGNGVTSLSSNLFFSGSSYGRMSTSSRWSMAYWQDITNGAHSWVTSTAAGTNASTPTMSTLMLLDASGNLGLGVTPNSTIFSGDETRLVVKGNANYYAGTIAVQSKGTVNAVTGFLTATDGSNAVHVGALTNSDLIFYTNGTSKATLNAAGNLGLGVTPASWAGGKAIQTGTATADASLSGLGDDTNIATNAYYNAGWKYINGGYTAARYRQSGGIHSWFTAPAGGSNGAAITFTQAMTLDASGNLGVGGSPTATHRILAAGPSAWMGLQRTSGVTNVLEYLDSSGVRLGYIGYVNNELHINQSKADKISFATGSTPAERLSIKSTGQVNFVGQASDPAGAAGDVVYNSTSNRLKYHNGTAWVDSGTRKVSVVGGAGTGTYIDATHNFNTKTVSVTVLRTTDNVVVYTDVAMTNDNTVRVTFASSVTLADYTVTVIG